MKYIISTIGKTKNKQEDLITFKYFKRIRNIELRQYEVKLNDEQKKLKRKD